MREGFLGRGVYTAIPPRRYRRSNEATIQFIVGLLLVLHVFGLAQAAKGIIPRIEADANFPGPSVSGTTKPNVPDIIRKTLHSYADIDERTSDAYPAHKAVQAMEADVGWDPTTSALKNEAAIARLTAAGVGTTYSEEDHARHVLGERQVHELMDIVIPTIRNLDFLKIWRPFVEAFHLILVQDGDPSKHIVIPDWANWELYNRIDIENALGDRAWIISQRDASIRNFGFLLSRKPFVWSLDDDCLPAMGPNGKLVNAPLQHALNLLTPSTPFFFNTVYDGYRPGSDFVRGYPYSLRRGVVTGISHGLWMNAYDYDAPTQLLKAGERNERYVDATITVPRGVLYPFCSMNAAFNRSAIGPAFMQGLMGVGQPWARYDDMFAGWASKVVSDHVGLGVKSGAPYIRHDKASNPFVNLEKEYMGLDWQEHVIRFMDTVELTPTADVSVAYVELSHKLELAVGHLSPYFSRLARAMRIWVALWQERETGVLTAIPSRSSVFGKQQKAGPKPTNQQRDETGGPSGGALLTPSSSATTCGVITYVHNEKHTLPIWLRYYQQHFHNEDIWILDHNTNDNSTRDSAIPSGVHVVRLVSDQSAIGKWMPHAFLNAVVTNHMSRMLAGGYRCVLLAEVDDIIAADPVRFPNGLQDLLRAFLDSNERYHCTLGMELAHISEGSASLEPELNWSKNLLPQRSYWGRHLLFNKPYLTKEVLNYSHGFHFANVRPHPRVHDGMYLIHLHHADQKYCDTREASKHAEYKDKGMVAVEQKAGSGARVGRLYDAEQKRGGICTRAHARVKEGGKGPLDVVDALGKELQRIPQKWRQGVVI